MSGSANNGYYTNGMADMTTALTGDERFGGDTNLENGATPQVAAFSPAQLTSGVMVVTVPTTGFSVTIPDGVTSYVQNPAGTLATGTYTMPANPAEGQVLNVVSMQTQTACTFTANTGQSFAVAAPTALTAKIGATFRYLAGVWYQTR